MFAEPFFLFIAFSVMRFLSFYPPLPYFLFRCAPLYVLFAYPSRYLVFPFNTLVISLFDSFKPLLFCVIYLFMYTSSLLAPFFWMIFSLLRI